MMPKLTVQLREESLSALQQGSVSIKDLLLDSLPLSAADIKNPENELVHKLLAYHSDDGGSVMITRIELNGATYDVGSKTGKADFKYFLSFHYACSYSEKDYEKHDKIDFEIDPDAGLLELTFLDVDTRSTSEEF
jgi:hypothetical protein